ncbi:MULTISPECIES: DNA mismatch repair endonuclease MutL [unclassified Mucilaginibacter]|uniref:DNA mismatch repair endonuclease MutL n=1 Tax=unclassified Mucilaginibacter TaxID=2617802 RepID=UPI00095A9F8F|nr:MULTISPECIES: DNA mismatch repair endonuclease MutL [unclassified Mucilaginibacter]OJW16505.1 MAG: DNA mismatch repair protein MutL [Mucilaginibacter sp. 44-25]PLW90574.1 MAG: DNA mismatch repair protein MutL [Mucilaginibacter sp.]PMP65126.1 MAG: DNA mismatch repair protein MutL [Mucilaginibacter sp.]HEK21778.1 DNA mismatch repair endonuclease MutL [Bacteroidota bacterium]
MPDIIQLLPDAVANQIAAGEVVQRPASAVKELIENAIDAGADKIQLILKDAGKALIQVIDNGCGMSLTDARMCFERHATSKIRKAEDLFAIRTMGFRGEAMASIAAIAQVELKTRRHEDELGTCILIEGSEVMSQEACSAPTGTSISIKNLFYNTPARRNFLKSNPVEMRHIIDEFQRVALANPQIFLTLHHDGQEVYHLPAASLKQRIVHLFGNNYNQRLVPVEEDTTIIKLHGYVGKPEFARKTRGEQFFFVNNRFIKDAYLNHAVLTAFQELLPDETYPLYVLFIDIDPAKIDINVHPTKTEIKYQDEKSIYAIIRSAVKRSLGKYNITPTLDFDQENSIGHLITPKPFEEIVQPSIAFNPDFNPFVTEKKTNEREPASYRNTGVSDHRTAIPRNWDTLYEIAKKEEVVQHQMHEEATVSVNEQDVAKSSEKQFFQVHNRYILSQIKSGFMLINQQAAHERILYERFLQQLQNHSGVSQQSLFPQSVTLNSADFELLKELLPDIRALGFDIREFGRNTVVVEGIPADLTNANEHELLEQLLEGFKNNLAILKLDKRDNLARSLARNGAMKAGTKLSMEEMNQLVDQLFACQMPNLALNGKPVISTVTLAELAERFEK